MSLVAETRVSHEAYIGEGVQLGVNVSVGPKAVILGPCVIEDNVYIGAGALIGSPPEMSDRRQNAAWAGDIDHAGVIIKRDAVIREGAVIHQGTFRETTIGERTWVLNQAYIAHDVLIGEAVTLSAGVTIGGHCLIGDYANIGMNAAVHQRTFISVGCMVGMGTPVTRDLPPFVKAFGSPVRVRGVNAVVLQRQGIDEKQIAELQRAYISGDVLFETNLVKWTGVLDDAVRSWVAHSPKNPALTDFVKR